MSWPCIWNCSMAAVSMADILAHTDQGRLTRIHRARIAACSGRRPRTTSPRSGSPTALAGRHPGADVASVEVIERDEVTNSHARLRVTYRDPGGAPEVMFCKLPPTDARREQIIATGWATARPASTPSWRRRSRCACPTAHVAMTDDDGMFAILLEDLVTTGCEVSDGTWGIPVDAMAGAIEDLAALHVRFDDPARRAAEAPWVPPADRRAPTPPRCCATASTTTASGSPTRSSRSPSSTSITTTSCSGSGTRGRTPSSTATSHIGNLFLDGGRVGFLDWGIINVNTPMRDISYFMTMAMAIDDRRAHERDLLRLYLDLRARRRRHRDHVRRRVARAPHPRRVQRDRVVPGGDVPRGDVRPPPDLRRRVPRARPGVARRSRGTCRAPGRRALSGGSGGGRADPRRDVLVDRQDPHPTGADWYPKKTMTAAERLAFYSAHFPIVEADSTYYFPPSPELTKSWVERTPKGSDEREGVLADDRSSDPARDVVAPTSATALPDGRSRQAQRVRPPPRPRCAGRGVGPVRRRAAPLADAGKLGAVLHAVSDVVRAEARQPRRARRGAEATGRPAGLRGVPGAELARHATTSIARSARSRDLDLGARRARRAEDSKLPKVVAGATDDLAVVRFHGRADDTWTARTGERGGALQVPLHRSASSGRGSRSSRSSPARRGRSTC